MPDRDAQPWPGPQPADASYSSTDITDPTGRSRKIYYRANTTDGPVIQQVLLNNHYDLGRLRRASELKDLLDRRRQTGKAPLIIDAGANIGAASIFFATIMPDASIVAIEPDAENFKLLQMNVAGLRVAPLRAAVASSEGMARVVDPGEGHWGYRTENLPGDAAADAVASVPRVTINGIYRENAAQCFPFIVKIDIEGGEADLFAGGTEWVADTPVLIIELHDWLLTGSGSSRSFLQCISRHDRDFVYLGEDVYSIANNLRAIISSA